MDRPTVSTENPWSTLSTSIGYENPWIRVEHNTVTTPSGSGGIYGVVRFKNRAVGIVPIDEHDHTWLVGQFRYTLNEYSWEMPAGGCPDGEDLASTATRELVEETGLVTGRLEPLLSGVRLSNSVTDESAWVFVATELTQTEAAPEDTEELAIWRLPVSDAIQMALDGQINDAFTVLAMLTLHAQRS